MSESVRIRVTRVTRQALKVLGSKGESYDDVLRRLIVFWVKIEQHGDPGIPKELLHIEEEVRE